MAVPLSCALVSRALIPLCRTSQTAQTDSAEPCRRPASSNDRLKPGSASDINSFAFAVAKPIRAAFICSIVSFALRRYSPIGAEALRTQT